MGRSWIFLAALAATLPARAAELYAAGARVYRIDRESGEIRGTSGAIGAAVHDLEIDPGGRYLALATNLGLILLHPGDLSPTDTLAIGVLDAVELSPDGDVLYCLKHPGAEREVVSGRHIVYAVRFGPALQATELATLGPRSYDMEISPDGTVLVVTNLMGRDLEIVDVATGRHERLRIEAGKGPENEMAVIRALAFLPDRRTAVLGESARGRTLCLWRLDLGSHEMTKREMPWPMHAANVLAVGDGIVVNGIDRIARASASDLEPIGVTELHCDAVHAVAGRDGVVYLAAHAETGARILRVREGEIAELALLPERIDQLAVPHDTGGR